MLRQRVITAFILIPLILFIIFGLQNRYFALCTGLILCVGAWEWSMLARLKQVLRYLYCVLYALVMGFIFFYVNQSSQIMLIMIGAIWWLCSFLILIMYQKTKKLALNTILISTIGFISLVPAWTGLVLLHQHHPDGTTILFFLMLLIWIADSSAYFIGRKWGRKPLAMEISPGKTREGFWGGMIIGTVFSLCYVTLIGMDEISVWLFVGVCIISILSSVAGDLFESMLKRLADLKDSGKILPGHGGVLDRIDSLVAACPVFITGLILAGMFE